ncbi:Zinc finger, CCHC-type [Sesbania bispinosa]|nr:Zinc finger, CCHC-type [Sesbania bispinosa]
MAEITASLQGLQQGVRQVDQQPGATTGGIEVTLAEFTKLKPPTFSGSNANEDPQRFIDGLERLWRALGCSDIRAVELASFQLEGVAYDWFDTVTRGRSVGSPPLAWGEFSRLFMARFLPESVRDGLAHEFERLEQTEEEMRVKRFVRGLRDLSSDKMRKGTVAEILARNSGLRDRRIVIPVLVWDRCPVIRCNREQYHRGVVSSGKSFGTAQSRRSDQGKSSRTTFPQRHFGVTSTPCPTCGRHHTGTCFGDSGVCYQCGQTGHIRRDCLVAVTQPSSSHASAPTALASSQDPSAPVRQLGGSSGRGSGVAKQSGRGSGGRGQAQAGTGILPICSRDAHVLFDLGATHSFVSLSFATQLGKSPSSLDETLAVTTPVGEILLADCVYRSCVVSFEGKELFANLIALDMVDFDVILGMDWLASHCDTLDCHNKVVKFEMPGESAFSFQGEQGWAPHNLISALAASKLLRKGCQGLAHLAEVKRPIVKEFQEPIDSEVQLEVSHLSSLLAHVHIHPTLVDDIKGAQGQDPHLVKLIEEVKRVKVQTFQLILVVF